MPRAFRSPLTARRTPMTSAFCRRQMSPHGPDAGDRSRRSYRSVVGQQSCARVRHCKRTKNVGGCSGATQMSQMPPEIAEDFRDRRVVLWLVQRYELKTGSEPHSLSASIDEIAPLYRTTPDARDAALMSWLWEAIWTEGVSGIVASTAKTSASTQGRRPIEIARAEDAQTPISNHRIPTDLRGSWTPRSICAAGNPL